MNSSCTILSPTIEYGKILYAIRSKCTANIRINGSEDNWICLTLLFDDRQLTLTRLVRERPGDRFSKLVLSMHNFFRTVETIAESNKNQILATIENVKMMIGVVAEPEFAADDDRLNCLWDITESLHALIFNGDSMLDLQGQRILSRNGEYDVII